MTYVPNAARRVTKLSPVKTKPSVQTVEKGTDHLIENVLNTCTRQKSWQHRPDSDAPSMRLKTMLSSASGRMEEDITS